MLKLPGDTRWLDRRGESLLLLNERSSPREIPSGQLLAQRAKHASCEFKETFLHKSYKTQLHIFPVAVVCGRTGQQEVFVVVACFIGRKGREERRGGSCEARRSLHIPCF